MTVDEHYELARQLLLTRASLRKVCQIAGDPYCDQVWPGLANLWGRLTVEFAQDHPDEKNPYFEIWGAP